MVQLIPHIKSAYQIRSYVKMTIKEEQKQKQFYLISNIGILHLYHLQWSGTYVSKEDSECWLILFAEVCIDFRK